MGCGCCRNPLAFGTASSLFRIGARGRAWLRRPNRHLDDALVSTHRLIEHRLNVKPPLQISSPSSAPLPFPSNTSITPAPLRASITSETAPAITEVMTGLTAEFSAHSTRGAARGIGLGVSQVLRIQVLRIPSAGTMSRLRRPLLNASIQKRPQNQSGSVR